MAPLRSRIGRACLRAGGWLARFLLRHLFAAAFVVLLLLMAVTVQRLRAAGIVGGMAMLQDLGIYLGLLIVVVILFVLKRYVMQLLRRAGAAAQKRAAKGLVDQGISRGEAALDKTLHRAGGTIAAMGAEAKGALGRVLTPDLPATPVGPTLARTCPGCRRVVPASARFCDVCGAELPTTCPNCGRRLRPGARFCDGCGSQVPTSR